MSYTGDLVRNTCEKVCCYQTEGKSGHSLENLQQLDDVRVRRQTAQCLDFSQVVDLKRHKHQHVEGTTLRGACWCRIASPCVNSLPRY
eukprot:9483670-Pyramimonas_sp.AAC.2